MAGKASADEHGKSVLYGFIIGLLTALPLIILIFIATAFDIRQFLVNVSPSLIEQLTFDQGHSYGSLILIVVMGVIGLLSLSCNLFSR